MAQDKPCLRRCGKGIELWCACSSTHTGMRESFGLMWLTHMQTCIYVRIIHTWTHTHKGKRIKRVGKSGLGRIFNGCHGIQGVAVAKPASWSPYSFQEDPVLYHLRLDIWPPERWEQTCLVLAQGWERVSDEDREHSFRSQQETKTSLWGWVCSTGLEDWPCPATFKATGQILSLGEGGLRGNFVMAGKCRVCLGLPVSHRKSYQKKDLGAHPTQELKTLV